jgi:bifunctional non-homologous end joining protein LigD
MGAMRPMLATRGTRVPTGPEWAHEVKWDGMRVLVRTGDAGVRIASRNDNDVTVSFPELQELCSGDCLGGMPAVLDGEVVAFTDGRPVFGALADRIHVGNARRAEQVAQTNPVTLIVFDLLHLDGNDLLELPWRQRRDVLTQVLSDGPRWQVPPSYDDGRLLMAATKEQGLEGIVSKRVSSPYRPGARSADWLKFPHRDGGSYVVGGWRPETAASRLGSVLVGEPTDEGLVYRGRVGSGLAGRAGERVAALLAGLSVSECPFVTEVPREDARGATWVRPEVVVEVASLGMTPQQRLRQPAFLHVRRDITPDDLLELGPHVGSGGG